MLIAGEPTRGADPEQAIAPQLDTILGDVPCDFPVIVAYEPSWAIGQPQPVQRHRRGRGRRRPGPDGIFLGRSGLAPENFLATVDEMRAVS